MKMNVAFSAYEFRGITPQCPEAETLRRKNTKTSSRIEIAVITGRKIKSVLFASRAYKTTIDISDMISGVYSYKYFVGENLIKSGKIIKQ